MPGSPIPMPQVDTDGPAVHKVVADVRKLMRRDGPMVLKADKDSRYELMRVFREFEENATEVDETATEPQKRGKVQVTIDPEEFWRMAEGHAHREIRPISLLVLITGSEAPLTNHIPRIVQKAMVDVYASPELRKDMPPILIVTETDPATLRDRKQITPELLDLVDGRLVVMPTAEERGVDELMAFFQSCIHRAAVRENVRYEMIKGSQALLRGMWAQLHPESLTELLVSANKIVADLASIAHSIVLPGDGNRGRRIKIDPKSVLNVFSPRSQLADPRKRNSQPAPRAGQAN